MQLGVWSGSVAAILALAVVLAACGSSASTATLVTIESTATSAEIAVACADVIDGTIRPTGNGTYAIDATVRSADTGWDKYADRWDVLDPQGAILGTRELAHPHENEQPFTRSLSNVAIPDTVEVVTLRARDSVVGYCGETRELAVNG